VSEPLAPGPSTLVEHLERRDLVFDDGLIGCPEWQRFVLEPDAAGPAILELRSLDEDGVALYVADPFTIQPEYEFEVGEEDSNALELTDPGDALVLVILTVRDESASVTANMLGPLVINVRTGRGRQLVLAESGYSVRHPIVG
jgi:flagellar assembly factor FliW